MIDLYAERTAPGLFNEPFNTVTNLAFIVAAWAVWRYARRRNALTTDIRVLIVLVAAIGVGSTIFHMFATRWALLLDVLPIALFLITYQWLYARRIMQLSLFATVGLVVLFFVTTRAVFEFAGEHIRSVGYVPALLFLTGLGVYQLVREREERLTLLAAAGTFALSITCRSLDYQVTDYLPMGSHFMWHILNGATLYLAVRALVAARVDTGGRNGQGGPGGRAAPMNPPIH